MKSSAYILMLTALLPAGLAGQEDPVERLAEVLPVDVAARVIEQVEAAQAQALPVEAVANLALEGVAKGRSGQEVLAAVETLVGDLGVARDALTAAGRAPEAGEVQAAAAAMDMGVDAAAISDFARSQPSGRSLAVPMLVIGSLTERGLPSDEALGQVAARLSQQADDAELAGSMAQMGRGMGQGGMPAPVGPALAGGMAGFQVPVSGINVPVGPPENLPGRPGNLPGGPGSTPTPPGPPSGGNPIG